MEHDPKDGFHLVDYRNSRERRVIEFILPILSPEKPKRLNITMANTLFGTLSRVRLVNWGRFIQEFVEKSLPHIGNKLSFSLPYILHLYQQHICINEAEEDALTIAEDEVVYKLGPEVEITEAGTKKLSDHAVLETPLVAPTPDSRKPTAPEPRQEAGPSKEPHWRDIDMSSFEYPEPPFKRVREELTDLHKQYFRLCQPKTYTLECILVQVRFRA